MADESGNGWAGTIGGATWVAGRYGQALSFGGADLVTIGNLELPGAFTVTGWMLTQSLYPGTCGSFVMKAHDYGFEVCDSVLSAAVGSGTAFTARVAKPLTSADLGVWRHVALTYDGATVRLYFEGALVSQATGTHGSNDNPLRFGRWSSVSEFWNGLIDEVRMYDHALTSTEIQTVRTTPVTGVSTLTTPLPRLAAYATWRSLQ